MKNFIMLFSDPQYLVALTERLFLMESFGFLLDMTETLG